ncbi:MAG: M3 family peptidase, partial [Brevundimonas sp.]
MHRRQLLIAGGSLMALSACASGGTADSMLGEYAAGTSPISLAEEARIARAVLPAATPRAELLQEWTGPYDGVPPWDKVTPAKLREALMEGMSLARADVAAIANNPEAPTFANTLVA